MKTTIHKYDNNLILTLPQAFVDALALQDNTEVDISLIQGTLVVTPLNTQAWTLEHLLAGVTDDNRHPEIDF